jgi:hypothetical protein
MDLRTYTGFTPRNARQIFFLLFFIAVVVNGSVFWLRRVGLVERESYRSYLEQYDAFPPVEQRTEDQALSLSEYTRNFTTEMYAVRGWELITKAFKDVAVLGFLICSVAMLMLKPRPRGFRCLIENNSSLLWALGGLCALVCFSGLISLGRHGFLLTLAGVRSFWFLPMALLGGWALRQQGWRLLVRTLLLLLPLELILAMVEQGRGLKTFVPHLPDGLLPVRAVGTLLQPSSLGITSVVLLAASIGAGLSGIMFYCLIGVVVGLVWMTGSATAWILLCLLGLFHAFLRFTIKQKIQLIVVALPLAGILLWQLPRVTGRPDLYDSLTGRGRIALGQFTQSESSWELIFGRGLGAGTNTAANLLMDWQTREADGYSENIVFISDSTPLTLTAQLGLTGCILFYGILLLAGLRDRQNTGLFVVIGVASLTVSVTELYPVNLILGLGLARSLLPDSCRRIDD